MIETVSLLSFFFLLWSWCSYKYYLETSYIARDQNILLCRKTKKDVTIAVPILDFSLLCSSVQFSHSVVSDSLRPHELQYARPPCPSPTLRVYSKSCLLNWWCHPTISPSVVSSPPPSIILSIRVFSNESVLRIRWPKYWSFSFSISPSASVLPMNIQDWFPLGWTGWISLQSKWLSRIFSSTTIQKHCFFSAQLSL